MWLIHTVVQQKLAQYCKEIILLKKLNHKILGGKQENSHITLKLLKIQNLQNIDKFDYTSPLSNMGLITQVHLLVDF